jgi:hypothetical protein
MAEWGMDIANELAMGTACGDAISSDAEPESCNLQLKPNDPLSAQISR